MKRIAYILVAMFGWVAMANASCTKNSMIGTWRVDFGEIGNSVNFKEIKKCEFSVQKDGSLKNSSCSIEDAFGKEVYYGVTGKMVSDAKCHVVSSMVVDYTNSMFPGVTEKSIDVYLNTKGNDVFIGNTLDQSSLNLGQSMQKEAKQKVYAVKIK